MGITSIHSYDTLYSVTNTIIVCAVKESPEKWITSNKVLQMAITFTQSGDVFFQCACCKHLPQSNRAKQSVLAPQRIENLYQSFMRFMMDHVSMCKYIPQEIKDLEPRATQNLRAMGIKKYWVTSAINMGLRNGGQGKGIIYNKTP